MLALGLAIAQYDFNPTLCQIEQCIELESSMKETCAVAKMHAVKTIFPPRVIFLVFETNTD